MRGFLLFILALLTLSGSSRLFGSHYGLYNFIKPIAFEISYNNAIRLVIHSPAPVCFPATINLSDPQITLGSDLDGVQLTYWEDAEATTVLANHTTLAVSGTYYIKATNQDLETMVLPVVVVVNQTPTISSISDKTLCKGDTQGAVSLISSVSNTSFVWNNSNNTIGLAESGTTNLEIPSFVALGNSLNAPTTSTITVQPTANGCTGNSTSFMVTVNPLPIATISGNTSICKDASPPTITFTGYYSTPPYTFTYQVNGGIEQTIATISGNSTTLTVPTDIPGVFTYSIKSVTSSTGCSQLQTGSATVTVNPIPFVTAPPDQNLCNGLMSSIIGLNGTPSSVVFDITGGTSIGLSDKIGVTEIPSFRPTSGSATITIIPRANGCVGLPVNFTIAVSPIPTMSSSPAYQTICSGATTNISLTSSTPGTTFAWTVGAIVPSGAVTNATNGTGNIINQSLTNTTPSNATVTYQVTPSLNGCNGTSLNIVVNVKPAPNLVITNPSSLCSPATVDLTASTVTAGSASGLDLSYWTNAAATNSLSNPSVVGNGTYYIKAIEPGTGCSTIKPVDVSIHLTPSVIITNPAPVCSPSKGNLTLPTVTTGSTADLTFTYWTNAVATLSYPTPTSADNGTYYIKGTTSSGCYDIKPVTVAVYSAPGIPVFTLGSSSNSCKNSAPITFTANATTAISLTYGLDAASLTAGNTINANTGEVTFAANWIGTCVITATATSCGISRTATHTVKVNPLPLVTLVASPSTAVCEGVPVTLTATSTGPTISGSSGNINKGIPNNSSASYSYSTITLSGSGGTLAAADLVQVTINISHHYDSDLDIFLVDPTGTKAMLLSSDNGGGGNEYTNTVFRTDAATLISSGSPPFTGTYRPEGTITTAPDRSGAVGGNYNLVVPGTALDGAVIDGAWSLRVFDDANNDSGILNNWSLSITKQSVGNFTTVVNGPQVIGPIAYSGTSNSIAKSVVTPTVGTNNYTVTTTDANGCTATSNQVAVVIKETPDATVIADYCSIQPKIKLTATGTGTYLWSTGETTKFISVDLVGIYTVTVTSSNGCQATGSINVSNELVTNGDFSLGNTGFSTPLSGTNQYTYKDDLSGVNNELNPEGLYGIGTNANNYHSNFWGVDHTSGTGNFMIVNGFPGTPQPVVWQQVKTVVPNTDYYFSAYAKSLNTAGNYANLQFSINGTTFGTNAQLTSGTGSDSNPWKPEDRFYGMWNSGSATSATIQIVDLQTAPNGNDFGLDDISFGTLAPLPGDVNPTTTSEICAGTTINLTANLTGGKSPFTYRWTGPNSFSSSLENPSIPNASYLNSGDYSLTFYDGYGCTPITKSVTVNVSNISTVNAGTDLSFCAPVSSISLDGTIGGSATSATWVGGLGTFDPNRSTLDAKYTPSNGEIESGSLTLTLTTDPVGACPAVSDQVTFTIYPLVTATIQDVVNPLCFGNYDGSARASVDGGTGPFSYSWNTSPPQTTATAYNLNAGTFSVTITDSHGCSDSESVTLIEPAALVVDENLQITQPDCISITSGSATVRIISGDSPSFLWSDGQTTATANNLLPGTYTISVTSVNGCSQIALQAVILPPDNLPPTFAIPAPFIQCVESLNNAIYNSSTMDINPDRPDYYIFPSGHTSLDLDPLVFTDNCPLSCTPEIRWKIEMKDGTRIPALPLTYSTGQPSTYGSPIQFSGDGLGFGDTPHTITYWVVDCAGNVSDPQSQTILIQPRPKVVKGL